MTLVAQGSDSHIFRNKEDIVDHLLISILANKTRKIGVEWELFFVKPEFLSDPSKKAFTRADGKRAFVEFDRVFRLKGYEPEFLYEENEGEKKIVGLNIPSLGTIVPEAGYQFEFASAVCNDTEELKEKIEEAQCAIKGVARRINCAAVFKGHVPGFAEKTENINRSRSLEWENYYASCRFSEKDRCVLREMQDGTASLQVTVDAGAENFHEFYKALLLIEPALTAYYKNSDRAYISTNEYSKIIPSQVEPIVDVWAANNPREVLSVLVERLMEIDVPFLPDPDNEGIYKAEPFKGNCPPKVKELMADGRLSEKVLNNIGGFFYTRPAFRKFSQGLLEIRGIDTQEDPKTVISIAQRVSFLVYNDIARKRLLRDYAHLTCADIQQLHQVANAAMGGDALHAKVAEMTVAAFIEDIISRSDRALPIAKPCCVNTEERTFWPPSHSAIPSQTRSSLRGTAPISAMPSPLLSLASCSQGGVH